MSPTVVVLVLLLLLPLALPAGADQSSPTADQAYAQSVDALRRGDFAQAVEAAQTARTAFVNVGNHQQQLAALLRMAEAYQGLGQPRAARQILQEAQPLAVDAPLALQAETLAARGQADWLSGEGDAARQPLQKAVEIARRGNDRRTAATALNTLGNMAASVGDHPAARAYYEQALAAVSDDDAALRVRIQLNAARTAWREGHATQAESWLQAALPAAQRLPPSHDKVFNLLALGQLLRELPSASPERQAAERVFSEAGEQALTLGDVRSASYAWGYRAQSAAGAHRDAEALALSRRAVTLAQQAQAPESLYRWQWQIGRLLQRQGDRDGAVLAYRQAALNLQSVRHEITADQRDRTHSFRDGGGVLLVELAQITPPVGLNLFVLQGLTRHDLTYVARTATPMFLLMLVAALLSYHFQDVILWLPSHM